MKAPSEAAFRRYVLLAFGVGLTTWEIVVRHAAEPVVFVVLGGWLGFKPMVHLDGLFSKKPEILPPEADSP